MSGKQIIVFMFITFNIFDCSQLFAQFGSPLPDRAIKNLLREVEEAQKKHAEAEKKNREEEETNRRSPVIENRIKQSFFDHKEFAWHQLEKKWDEKKYCGIALGHQNHGHWKNDGYAYEPDWNTLRVTINPNRINVRAEFVANARGDFHHIMWESGIRGIEMRVKATAKAKFVVDFDGARSPKTKIDMTITDHSITGAGELHVLAEAAFTVGAMIGQLKMKEYEAEFGKVTEDFLAGK